jgi:hypothetical protein
MVLLAEITRNSSTILRCGTADDMYTGWTALHLSKHARLPVESMAVFAARLCECDSRYHQPCRPAASTWSSKTGQISGPRVGCSGRSRGREEVCVLVAVTRHVALSRLWRPGRGAFNAPSVSGWNDFAWPTHTHFSQSVLTRTSPSLSSARCFYVAPWPLCHAHP